MKIDDIFFPATDVPGISSIDCAERSRFNVSDLAKVIQGKCESGAVTIGYDLNGVGYTIEVRDSIITKIKQEADMVWP